MLKQGHMTLFLIELIALAIFNNLVLIFSSNSEFIDSNAIPANNS